VRDRGGPARQESLQALDRAFALLDLLTPDRPEWTTSELARSSGLPVATAHRILAALRGHGYVARDPRTKRYRLGPAARELGARAGVADDLRDAALPVLERLARAVDETALLTVPSERRDASVCLARVESSQPLRLSVEPGRRLPLHAGASQKALLAFLAPADVERVVGAPLPSLCTETITDPDALRADLDEIRQRGWAVSREETNAGVWGVALPLLDAEGRAIAALGLAGPIARSEAVDERTQLELLAGGARELAAQLDLTVPEVSEWR
jgi:DNA-binding IclR family transcriptional regulator